MRNYGHTLAIDARKMLARSWGTDILAPENMIGMLATLELPGNPKDTDTHTATLHDKLRDEFHIEIPVIAMDGHTYVRISAQIYNYMEEYERLDRAVKSVFSR